MNAASPRLESAIRDHFAPLLRKEGFAGSGRTFRRARDEVVHVVNVQGFWFGGCFAVNLSVHPLGLPCVDGQPADLKKITEEKCEFWYRLTEGPAGRVWDHDGTAEGMAAAVANAAAVFEQYGLAFFRLFSGPQSLLLTLTPSTLDVDAETLRLFCMGSSIRLAYTFARVRALQGQHSDAVAFARWALSHGAQPSFQGHKELLRLANDA